MKTTVQFSSILAKLEEVAANNDSAPAYLEYLLRELSIALSANAAACWMFDHQQSVGLLAEYQFATLGFRDDLQSTRLNQRILGDTFSVNNPRIVPFLTAQNPNIAFVLLVPLIHKGSCIGALEFFANGEPWELDSEIRQNFNAVNLIIDHYLERLEELTQVTDPSIFLDEFKTFCEALHCNLDPAVIAVTAVNDAASILKCDRATLLLKRGSRWDVVAVSGRGTVNVRSNQIQLLQRLTQHAAIARDVLLYNGKNDTIPASVVEPLAAYVSESGSRMLMLHPLVQPTPQTQRFAESTSAGRRHGRLLGAFVLEQFTASRPSPALTKYADAVCTQVTMAMSNAITYRRVPLLPLLDLAGQQLEFIRRHSFAKLIAIMSLCLCLIAVLCKTQSAYRVNANGKLMPAMQRRVFTEFDGEVDEVLIRPGELVEVGTPLITLKNDAFVSELLLLKSQSDERRKSLLGLNSELHSASKTGNREHLLQLQAAIEQCRIDLSSLQYRIDQAEQRLKRMTLRAPIAGTVVTYMDAQQLIGKPVRRGDTLLEVMDESGPWRLELEIPEHRMHHLRHGITVFGDDLPASFKLTADPTQEFTGQLSYTAERSTINPETGSVVKVYVRLDDKQDLPKRIGADVRSRLECGNYSLLHVWFGDAIDYVRRELWF